MNSSLTRPLAIVTGASNGIGYELAKQFAQNGFDLLVTATGSSINEAAEVAKQGFEALMAGKDHIIAGSLKTKLLANVSKVLPDTVSAEQHRKLSEPESGNN
ncbi:SDR family NAD(P)-dependent oxidoreductase [Nostoc sp. UHCC 0252]|uniref:SDR family NAD(P)-dependent oxidoreductase n=1 Tax=Nostoc sp. UHCC 0252 TaxID=3110241 RepID=UPI002B1F65FC|nr:SDR family NAD(P)-dependent oxidoreductase [Nostoc sp. UHCC 0252]MEA5604139.1 SDR family NAD(P)-dependent oxidoreductase [Nostoc sp. UHCC 0252]